MITIKTPGKTTTEYHRRIHLALAFIERHLDENIRLDDIARASHFSPYHFHRLFHALVGETVNDYVSRKRMEKAAYRLMAKPELSISEVAEIGGFSSARILPKRLSHILG